jgi:hypothetical protein
MGRRDGKEGRIMSDDHFSRLVCPNPDGQRTGFVETRQPQRGAQGATALSGQVAVTRARDCAGVFSSVPLLLDDDLELGTIAYGSRRVFLLLPGVHTVAVEDAWCGSPPYKVEVRPGETVELEVSIRWRGLLWCLSLLTVFLLPGRAYVIRTAPRQEDRRPYQPLWEAVRVGVGMVLSLAISLALVILVATLLE